MAIAQFWVWIDLSRKALEMIRDLHCTCTAASTCIFRSEKKIDWFTISPLMCTKHGTHTIQTRRHRCRRVALVSDGRRSAMLHCCTNVCTRTGIRTRTRVYTAIQRIPLLPPCRDPSLLHSTSKITHRTTTPLRRNRTPITANRNDSYRHEGRATCHHTHPQPGACVYTVEECTYVSPRVRTCHAFTHTHPHKRVHPHASMPTGMYIRSQH